jgi:hypothetical protein
VTAAWDPGGRSGLWRLGVGLAGLVLLTGATALVWRPALLAYAVAAGLGLLGLLLLVSAFAARGRARRE